MTKILVADDDPQLLRALRITLRARGYDVDTNWNPTPRIPALWYSPRSR